MVARKFIPKPVERAFVSQPASVQQMLDAIYTNTNVREGWVGSELDRFVTIRDLYEGGLVKVLDGGVYVNFKGTSATPIIPAGADPVADYAIPPAPTGFVVAAGMGVNGLSWTNPTTLYSNHSYTEIWRNSTNNLGTAAKIGTANFSLYIDSTGTTNTTYYYWIRFVSQADKTGPYNATGGTVGITGYVVAANILVANLAAINVDAGTLTAGTLTGLTIQTATSGARIVMNASNFIAYDSGSVAKTTISGSTGRLTAVDVDVSGTVTTTNLNATGGTIGGFTIDADEIKSTNMAMDSTNQRFWIKSSTFGADGVQIDYSGTAGRIYAGNGANDFIKKDSTGVSIGRDTQLIGADAYNNNSLYTYIPAGFDAWATATSGTGSVTRSSGVRMTLSLPANSAGTDTSQAAIYYQGGGIVDTTFSKSSRIKFMLYLDSPSSQYDAREIYCVYSFVNDAKGLGPRYGMKITATGGTVTAKALSVPSGSSTETLSSGSVTVSVGQATKFEFVFTSGTSVEGFAGGTSFGSVTTNLPSGSAVFASQFLAKFYQTATANSALANFHIYDVKFQQDP